MATSLPIPSDFACSYNGFTFDPAHAATTGLTVTPVPDETGRTVAYNKIYLKLKTEVIGQPTDATVLQARRQLTKYGGALVYGGRGIGPLSINTGRVRDIVFGPKPKLLSLKPLGYRNACEIEWEVDVHIPECADARYSLGVLSLAYRMEFKLTAGGRVDQAVSGTLKVPNNRVAPGSEDVIDSPDRYRDKIAPPVPFWHHREWQPWRVSEDRTSLGFGWTDREFGENVLPPGVVDAKVSHGVRQAKDGVAFVNAMGTIRGTYTLDAAADATVAMRAFFRLIEKRVYGRNRAMLPGFTDPNRKSGPVVMIPASFEAEEPDVYAQDRRCVFSFRYKLFNTDLTTILRDTGLWEPADTDWPGWYKSVAGSAMHPYGFSRVTFTPYGDQIVDLCQANPGGLKPIGGTRRVLQGELGGIPLPPIEESGSWDRYVNHLYVESDSGLVQIRALAGRPFAKPKKGPAEAVLKGGDLPRAKEVLEIQRPIAPDPDAYQSLAPLIAEKLGRRPAEGKGGNGAGAGAGKGDPPPPDVAVAKAPPDPDDTPIQQRTGSLVVLHLIGEAVRVGFEIGPPTLGDVDGMTPEPSSRLDMGEGFVTGIVGQTATGVPIYGPVETAIRPPRPADRPDPPARPVHLARPAARLTPPPRGPPMPTDAGPTTADLLDRLPPLDGTIRRASTADAVAFIRAVAAATEFDEFRAAHARCLEPVPDPPAPAEASESEARLVEFTLKAVRLREYAEADGQAADALTGDRRVDFALVLPLFTAMRRRLRGMTELLLSTAGTPLARPLALGLTDALDRMAAGEDLVRTARAFLRPQPAVPESPR